MQGRSNDWGHGGGAGGGGGGGGNFRHNGDISKTVSPRNQSYKTDPSDLGVPLSDEHIFNFQ